MKIDMEEFNKKTGPQGKMANTDFSGGPQGELSAKNYEYPDFRKNNIIEDVQRRVAESGGTLSQSQSIAVQEAVRMFAADALEQTYQRSKRETERVKAELELENIIDNSTTEILSEDVSVAPTKETADIEKPKDDARLPTPFPFQICSVKNTDSSVTVQVRNGGFYSADQFLGTDGSTSFAAFDLFSTQEFAASDNVIAYLVINASGVWSSAGLSDEEVTIDPSLGRVINVLVGKIGPNGEINQQVLGHISVADLTLDELSIDKNTSGEVEIKGYQAALAHQVPTKGAAGVAFDWIVKGPGATASEPAGISGGTMVVDVTAWGGTDGLGVVRLTKTTRSHDVENGKEAWGLDSTEDVDLYIDGDEIRDPWPVYPPHEGLSELGWELSGHFGRRTPLTDPYTGITLAGFDANGNAKEYPLDGSAGGITHGDLAGLGDDDHAQYLKRDGDAARNSMSGVIGDAAGTPVASIDPSNRQLLGSDGLGTLDYGLKQLVDSDGVTDPVVVDWGDQKLNDTSGNLSLAWDTDGVKVPDGKDYYHNNLQGITGDGFSGGIKVSAAAAEAAAIESTELYT